MVNKIANGWGGCSSASSSVSEEEDGSGDITVITVVINSRTSVYLWLGGWLASIYRTIRDLSFAAIVSPQVVSPLEA